MQCLKSPFPRVVRRVPDPELLFRTNHSARREEEMLPILVQEEVPRGQALPDFPSDLGRQEVPILPGLDAVAIAVDQVFRTAVDLQYS